MATQPQENAIAIYIRYQVLDENEAPRDISGAIIKQLIFERPNKSILTVEGQFFTNGADGILQYITVEGDLIPDGIYQVQAELVMPGFNGRTEVRLFQVKRNLPI
jgi:hypothetical protein